MTATTAKKMLLAGDWVSSDYTIDSINPATGKLNFKVSSADNNQVNLAVSAAQDAFNQASWRAMLPHHRANLLYKISEGINKYSLEFAKLQMVENGKVFRECQAQALSAASTFRYYAGICETTESEVTTPRGNYLSFIEYEPYGVVAAITPWNSPLTMEAQKIAPSLAAGNAVILKPSEVTPSVGLLLGDIAMKAGLPKGILTVLPGSGNVTGKSLIEHPGVNMISFTGGTSTGRRIASVAADRLVPIALELGGKSPHIIFEDANLDAAATGVCDGIFEGTGQSCIAGSRLFLQKSIAKKFLDILLKKASEIRVGMPDASNVDIGPMSSFIQREKVASYVQLAKDEGGDILLGGFAPKNFELKNGAFYLPTIIGGLSSSARVVKEEIFGPVLCVLIFDDEEDVIYQANDSVFGLAGGVWTANYQRAWRVAKALKTGLVWINTYKQLSIATSFGGFKESGLGREKGPGGMRLYQQSKGIYLSLDEKNLNQ